MRTLRRHATKYRSGTLRLPIYDPDRRPVPRRLRFRTIIPEPRAPETAGGNARVATPVAPQPPSREDFRRLRSAGARRARGSQPPRGDGD